jgi:hypothetical protein
VRPRVFSFERALWEALDLVPLGVRRNLDLAEVKLSLDGWQALPLDDRRALRDATSEAFPALLRACAARAGVALSALPLPEGGPPWRSAEVPGAVRARLADLGAALDGEPWRALDDEARYVLAKLAEKKREPERFAVAARELGIGLIPAPAGDKGPRS